MLTVKQLAERWGVAPSLIYSLVAEGKLACCRIGHGRGVIRFTEEHIAAYLDGTTPRVEPRKAPTPRLKHLKL